MTEEELITRVDEKVLLNRSLSEWKPILARECSVYIADGVYLAKKFDEIHYQFCSKDEAKEILIDNLYCLLKYKYFTKLTEDVEDRITKIVNSFVVNLKTTLINVSFNECVNGCKLVKYLPDYCVAFRNGVYNFKDNEWFLKYEIVTIPQLSNALYLYDNKYVITWFMNYNFEPLPINIIDTPLIDFISMMKEITKENKNYCFELLYNMSHNSNDKFDLDRFTHLCQILGYSILQSFSQFFILLIGSGQNGKNSLFDGCFTAKLVPRPASIDMDTIENDRFVTGALQNHSHNIFLETDAKVQKQSKILKALTGSMYQSVEEKGVSKYSGIINCKFLFAGNDRDSIKFDDNTVGFRRRINLFEIYYHWDFRKKFLLKGDYYDTSFSNDLHEITSDALNNSIYIYFAMYGICSATKQFAESFKFTYNEWNDTFSSIDETIRDCITSITLDTIYSFLIDKGDSSYESSFFDENKKPIKLSPTFKSLGCNSYDGLLKILQDEELRVEFFNNNDIYINIRTLQKFSGNISTSTYFTHSLKKTFKIDNLDKLYANIPYVKCRFINGKIQIIN